MPTLSLTWDASFSHIGGDRGESFEFETRQQAIDFANSEFKVPEISWEEDQDFEGSNFLSFEDEFLDMRGTIE